MQYSTHRGNGEAGEQSGEHTTPEREISQDGTLEVFSNQRRRFTVHFLKQGDEDQVTVSEIADRVASWENDKPVEQLTHQERKRVRNALRQFHLPKMADYGFVEYDSQRGTVSLTAAAANANFYVDSLTGSEIPWGVYYLGLSSLGVVCVLGFWAGVAPFTVFGPLAYSSFFVTAMTVFSLGHVYDTHYRMRLGTQERPSEVQG